MKIKITYFYHVRNLRQYQIPVSTAVWDPKWFHENTGNNKHIFIDKRGVVNGVRFTPFVPNRTLQNLCRGKDKCANVCPGSCDFLVGYRMQLREVDFSMVLDYFRFLGEKFKEDLDFDEEPEIILMVYETPDNKCSEREELKDYFYSNNYVLEEYERD